MHNAETASTQLRVDQIDGLVGQAAERARCALWRVQQFELGSIQALSMSDNS